jgi:N-acetyltransferase
MIVESVKLEGNSVVLDPMTVSHTDGLFSAASDISLWKWTTSEVRIRQDMADYVATALVDKQNGLAVPFVTREKNSNQIIGSTRFGNIDVKNRRCEIGWTWVAPSWQRTAVNTEAKFLMLCHAFETWKCVRVELKTDALNEKSRRAISRLGATEEGILRRHMLTYTGRFRDSVFFSILDSEWAAVKQNLRGRLDC